MTDCLPEPLVPAMVDLRDLDGFMLNTQQLLASELWALTRQAPEAFRAAAALWCQAWKQVPAASLPDDEATLAAFAELPLARFRKLRPLVTRGFVLCNDGRLYHHVLAADALKAYGHKLKYQVRREADRKRLEEWRENKRRNRGDTPDETADETRFERSSTGTGTGTSSSLRSEESSAPAERPARQARRQGTRLPEDWQPTPSEIDYARSQGLGEQRIANVIENFRDYWTVGKGRNVTHADWTRAWQGWVRNDASRNVGASNGSGFGRKQSGAETLFAAAVEVARDGADHG